jgi:DNA-binding IclR family transcriptional regulator
MTRSPSLVEAPPSTMLGRVFAILEAFSTGEPELSLAELAVRTKIPKPSAYRISKEMVEHGLLERSPAGFRLGVRLFELGELVSGQRQFRDAALPDLEELFERTHEVVNFGVLNGTDVLYYAKIVGHKGLAVPTRVGGRWPAHATALGKAMLAFGPQHVLRRLLASGLQRLTPYTITDPRRLLRQLEEVRRKGVAFEYEESALGVSCVAAPTFANGQAVAALSVTGPPLRLRPERWEPAVKRAAASISRKLSEGAPTPTVTTRPG